MYHNQMTYMYMYVDLHTKSKVRYDSQETEQQFITESLTVAITIMHVGSLQSIQEARFVLSCMSGCEQAAGESV